LKNSSLIAPLVVGLFVLSLVTFFSCVIVVLHGPLSAGAAGSLATVAYSVLGLVGAVGLGCIIAADALVQRRIADPNAAANPTRAVRAGCAWLVGMLGALCVALVGEWAMVAAPVAGLVVMALQWPRNRGSFGG
jgi:hypothetical protein